MMRKRMIYKLKSWLILGLHGLKQITKELNFTKCILQNSEEKGRPTYITPGAYNGKN